MRPHVLEEQPEPPAELQEDRFTSNRGDGKTPEAVLAANPGPRVAPCRHEKPRDRPRGGRPGARLGLQLSLRPCDSAGPEAAGGSAGKRTARTHPLGQRSGSLTVLLGASAPPRPLAIVLLLEGRSAVWGGEGRGWAPQGALTSRVTSVPPTAASPLANCPPGPGGHRRVGDGLGGHGVQAPWGVALEHVRP